MSAGLVPRAQTLHSVATDIARLPNGQRHVSGLRTLRKLVERFTRRVNRASATADARRLKLQKITDVSKGQVSTLCQHPPCIKVANKFYVGYYDGADL